MKSYIKKILFYFKNAIKFIRKGGVVYVNIGQLNQGNVLLNKRVLITGGTSGIGYSIAKKFLSEGAIVLITGRDEHRLLNAANSLGGNVHTLLWDVSDTTITNDQIQKTVNILGGIDILINNAGIYTNESFYSVTEDIWNVVMDTNIKGTFFICQTAAQKMAQNNDGGKIINISSIAGYQGYSSPYGISKASLNNLTIGLAKKLITNKIIVNGIAPGNTATNMTGINVENLYDTLGKNHRAALPEEIAEIALFLASDAANNIVGQTIICDGGATLI